MDDQLIESIAKDIYYKRILLPEHRVTDIQHNIQEYLDFLKPANPNLSQEKPDGRIESDYEFVEIMTKLPFIKAWVKKRYDEFIPIWLPFFNTYFKGKQFHEVFTDYLKSKPYP